MTLNALSSRIGHEFQRHPIFPNVVANYAGSKPAIQGSTMFNKFSKSMFSGSFKFKLEESSLWETGIPVNFLERKHHYLDIIGEGGHFESCIEIKNVNPKPTELIPEFFSEPSFLFGNRWKNPVILPKYLPDPFSFVTFHRRALESDEVADWLGRWIDSVFGVDSKALELAQTHTSDSTLQITTHEYHDIKHLKIFSDLHPKRKSKLELRTKHFLEPSHQPSLFEPFNKLADQNMVLLTANLSSNKVAFITKNRLLIYDSAVCSKVESKTDNQGLYVVQEASLSGECMERMSGPYHFVWQKCALLANSKTTPGSLAVYDVAAGSLEQLAVARCPATHILAVPATADVVVGTLDGAVVVVSFARLVPQIISSFFMDTQLVTGKV